MSEKRFAVTSHCGEKPLAYVEEIEIAGAIPGYGVMRICSNNSLIPYRSSDVFETEAEAKAAAASRLRKGLADISMAYEKKIEELSA